MTESNATDDIRFMTQALTLAARGVGWTSPNPMVGAIVVKDGSIIAEGYHARCGETHAERAALDSAGTRAVGATLYVTLEPCSHQGRTPPCLDRVLESRIARVVIAMSDPNPQVNGRSIAALREAGVAVEVGVCEREARALNLPFLSSQLRSRPWVTLKYAMTLDGRIATGSGDSRWISSEASRKFVHDLRRRNRAILVGATTVLRDNPMLDCRLSDYDPPPRQPLRVVVGGNQPLPSDSALRTTAEHNPVLHFINLEQGREIPPEPSPGYTVIPTPHSTSTAAQGRLDLAWVIQHLHDSHEVDSLLVEGGGHIHGSFVAARLADEVYAFVAPKILNDPTGIAPLVGPDSAAQMSDALELVTPKVSEIGGDVLIQGYLNLFLEEA